MSELFETMTTLTQHYEELWQTGLAAFEQGRVDLDPFLPHKEADRRRGLSLIIRPNDAVVREISEFLTALTTLEPAQYAYPPGDYHLTVLSLFSATAQYQPYLAQLPTYRAAVDAVLCQTPPFTLQFRGITATPGAVMIQGFPQDGTLDEVREQVRQELTQAGLGAGLDSRYRIRTAHATVFRFQQPLREARRFCARLRAYRHHPFGQMRVEAIDLVKNDWYMSTDRVRLVKQYVLDGAF